MISNICFATTFNSMYSMRLEELINNTIKRFRDRQLKKKILAYKKKLKWKEINQE